MCLAGLGGAAALALTAACTAVPASVLSSYTSALSLEVWNPTPFLVDPSSLRIGVEMRSHDAGREGADLVERLCAPGAARGALAPTVTRQ